MANGLNEPEIPLSPTAQTVPAPGVADTEFSTLGLPASGLATVVHAVPFQLSVRVCASVVPVGWVTPTAHTSLAALDVVTLVRLSPAPGEGLGTMLHAVPFQCSMSVLPELVPAIPEPPTAHTSVGLFALIELNWKNAFPFELPTSPWSDRRCARALPRV